MRSSVDSPPSLTASATLPTTSGSSAIPSVPPLAAATTTGTYAMLRRHVRSPASAALRSRIARDAPSHERASSPHCAASALASCRRNSGVIASYRASCPAASVRRCLATAAALRRLAFLRSNQRSGPRITRPVAPSARSYPRSIQPRFKSTAPSWRPLRFAYSACTALPLPRATSERTSSDDWLSRTSASAWRCGMRKMSAAQTGTPRFWTARAVAGLASLAGGAPWPRSEDAASCVASPCAEERFPTTLPGAWARDPFRRA